MNLDKIPPCAGDGSVNVLVEIPRGSVNKYEYRHDLGVIVLDRPLYSAVYYPADYGFVPGTEGTDGEPVDILVLVEEGTFPGCLVQARLLGVLTIQRTDGQPEQKLLAVPVRQPRFAEYRDVRDVPTHLLREIEHFFEVFKDLEGSNIQSLGWEGVEIASRVLDEAVRR